MRTTRRRFLSGGVVAASAAMLIAPALAQGRAHVVVLGGGFAGATCARELQRADPRLAVTLVEEKTIYMACPFSNPVIAGLRDIAAQHFGYDTLRGEGIAVVQDRASSVDQQRRLVSLSGGSALGYDRMVVAPGIDIRWGALPGYDQAAAEPMPHAWIAGEQTLLLRRQLEEMADGGTVMISAPANPFRCPPGPYERASLIAYYLKTKKPRLKLIVLDAKDSFSKQRPFQGAWQQLYPALLEWVSLSNGGKVTSVDPATRTLVTEFATYKADVANVIPPQRAGLIAEIAGVSDQAGWCPIDPVTFESRLRANIHVIGDAAITGAMPKSALAANAQAKVCAAAVTALLHDETPPSPKLINTCYSLVAPDYGISIAGVYHPVNGQLADVGGAGGVSQPTRHPTSAHSRRPMRKPGFARSRPTPSADPSAALVAAVLWTASLATAQQPLQPSEIVGDSVPGSLTRAVGDPTRGRAIVVDRRLGACLLCHTGPFPEERFQGTLAPIGRRRVRAGRQVNWGCGWSTRPASTPTRSCRPTIG
jgi:NADPH-dependent 2,4-dienoyl-CoA reductase/sulfur reductase-like enzyme